MGKGDKGSRRGKISAGSYGNVRPKPAVKSATPGAAPAKAAAKTARKKT